MFLAKMLNFRAPLITKRYYGYVPKRIDKIPIPVSPHSSYILSRRGFGPALKYELYDPARHPTKEDLTNYEEHELIRTLNGHLPRPFDRMEYEGVCRYIEWSYPYTGLDIMGHLNNIKKLVGDTSYERTVKLIDVYRVRYNIEDKVVYDKSDLTRLIKPYRITMKAIKNKKKRVYSYFIVKNKEEIIMELQRRKQTASDPSKVFFSTVASDMFKSVTPEQVEEFEKAIEEDWLNIKEVFQYDVAKEAWRSRDSYSDVSPSAARKLAADREKDGYVDV
ncbi:hypothetical protein D499_0L00830 [Hanseniaspora uvarum DSM 2768]|nr:hypothetical protein D499_0L00830 [Hanseniaspora uvarum DSM 2768]